MTKDRKENWEDESSSEELDDDDDDEEEEEEPPLEEEASTNTTPTTSVEPNQTPSTTSAAAPPPQKLASVRDVFSYGTGWVKAVCLSVGFVCAVVAGGIAPAMIFAFSRSFEDLAAPPTSAKFMDTVRELTWIFLGLGVVAFASLCGYATLLETSANNMTNDLKQRWFRALIRQDMAYFDIQDVTGIATYVEDHSCFDTSWMLFTWFFFLHQSSSFVLFCLGL
jgi:ABC-type multidrug transport system fused ATPase/permease subunit